MSLVCVFLLFSCLVCVFFPFLVLSRLCGSSVLFSLICVVFLFSCLCSSLISSVYVVSVVFFLEFSLSSVPHSHQSTREGKQSDFTPRLAKICQYYTTDIDSWEQYSMMFIFHDFNTVNLYICSLFLSSLHCFILIVVPSFRENVRRWVRGDVPSTAP